MTPSEERLARLITGRVRRMQPEMARAWLRCVALLRRTLDATDVAQIIEAGQVDAILSDAAIDRAFLPLREQLRSAAAEAFRLASSALPRAGMVNEVPAVGFDVLSPRVRQALETLDRQILAPAKEGVRETVRQSVLAGVERGVNPREIARGVRDVVGLAPNQELAVRNFERALRDGDTAKALGYKLRDRRFDRTVRKGALTEEQIQRMVGAYRKKFEAHHAETIARTATLNSYRTGQHESYGAAIAAGIIDPVLAQKTWVNVGDDLVRESHQNDEGGIGGETVPYAMPFSNGLMFPSEWNCRCFVRYTQRRG